MYLNYNSDLDHRHSHSFPTLRSSDLPDEQLRRVMPVLEALAGATDLTALLSIDTTQAPVAEAALKSGVGIVNDISDRKSTRLNSSHSSISYAVFCLKKKNKQLATHTT